ncbi:acetylglutamate kinase [Flavobacteriaceae bacterium UJ101]|nr:acetylglutamate kinase [Flavobacteriaceae bacterium UJ101]
MNSKQDITILKIGGNVINDPTLLKEVLIDFASITTPKILIHGGGKIAGNLSKKLGIEPKMHEGRRITDQETLDIVTMVYAGLLNKRIVSLLQEAKCNAIGLSGADANTIQANKRPVKDIDYGFVGDLNSESINESALTIFLQNGLTPVFCAITHNKKGQLFNTNADTIASSIANQLASTQHVRLIYCFEKKGVLQDIEDEDSYIPKITPEIYQDLKSKNIIFEGMIPKLDNAFNSINKGVKEVILCNPSNIKTLEEKTILCL